MLLFASPMAGPEMPAQVFQCCCFIPMFALPAVVAIIGLRILIK